MSRARSPFSPKVVFGMVAVGAVAFLLLLYAIGAGWDGSDERDGGAHGASNGLTGFAGLVRLLEARDHEVVLSRSEARLDHPGLLVLTPPIFAQGDRLAEIVEARRYVGPTLLVLPKWLATPADHIPRVSAPEGWVALNGSAAPRWVAEIEGLQDAEPEVAERRRWRGLGLDGALPDPQQALSVDASRLVPLVTDERGDVLAGYLDDGGHYPVLDDAATMPPRDAEELGLDTTRWAFVVIAEPDLMNNFGMADRTRADLAVRIIDAAKEGQDLPVVFDLTLPGLGSSENLLTLAFRPPFLAATLCLLLAALVVAWRAFHRFGPPVAEAHTFAMGKRQLARNGARLIERTRRFHLLGPPYATIVTARLANALGIRETEPSSREVAVERALASRGIATDYSERVAVLRKARRPGELLRAASALHSIERTVKS